MDNIHLRVTLKLRELNLLALEVYESEEHFSNKESIRSPHATSVMMSRHGDVAKSSLHDKSVEHEVIDPYTEE